MHHLHTSCSISRISRRENIKKKKKRIQTSESNRESELFDSTARSSLCLCLQAYFGDSYTSLHVYRDYTSPSHSYLSIQRPLTPLEVRLGNGNNNSASSNG